MTESASIGPTRRSDGAQTHAAILEAAVRLASIEGIGGLTLGRLAQEVGVSKSGLYAHFGSKLGLQLEIVQAAREIFQRQVVDPALEAPPGHARLERLCDAYLSYVERSVFPGGCFFAGMLAEFDARTGALHQEVAEDQREWLELVAGLAQEARARGELRAEADLDQLVFEITAALEHANYYWVLFSDPRVTARAREAVRRSLARAAK